MSITAPFAATSSVPSTPPSRKRTQFKTPEKLPWTPQKKYPVRRQAIRTKTGKIAYKALAQFSPNAKQRKKNGVIYSWELLFKNLQLKIYVGETKQPLTRRSYQHLRQAKNCRGLKDYFHMHLKDFANNPNSDIAEINICQRYVPETGTDLRKSEELYILAEDSMAGNSGGQNAAGLNRIHAHSQIHKRRSLGELQITQKQNNGHREFQIEKKQTHSPSSANVMTGPPPIKRIRRQLFKP